MKSENNAAIINNFGFTFIFALTFGGMESKGLRAITYQGTRKVEAGYNPLHISELLIGYIACYTL